MSEISKSLISEARQRYHAQLFKGVLSLDADGIPSNADKHSRISVAIAKGIAQQLKLETMEKLAGQRSGSEFETANADFVRETFLHLGHIRPGDWEVRKVAGRGRLAVADFEQYSHLDALAQAAKASPELAAALGNDYTISPDVIVIRGLLTDAQINETAPVIDQSVCGKAALRASNGGKPLLHASVSSKWTIRSDRSQNSRAEALNLIRNRKGHLPHIVVVTGEPLPSRLSSIALGTGDIDCVYHFALPELEAAVEQCGEEEALSLLRIMVQGKRLKDISDLPLDMAV